MSPARTDLRPGSSTARSSRCGERSTGHAFACSGEWRLVNVFSS